MSQKGTKEYEIDPDFIIEELLSPRDFRDLNPYDILNNLKESLSFLVNLFKQISDYNYDITFSKKELPFFIIKTISENLYFPPKAFILRKVNLEREKFDKKSIDPSSMKKKLDEFIEHGILFEVKYDKYRPPLTKIQKSLMPNLLFFGYLDLINFCANRIQEIFDNVFGNDYTFENIFKYHDWLVDNDNIFSDPERRILGKSIKTGLTPKIIFPVKCMKEKCDVRCKKYFYEYFELIIHTYLGRELDYNEIQDIIKIPKILYFTKNLIQLSSEEKKLFNLCKEIRGKDKSKFNEKIEFIKKKIITRTSNYFLCQFEIRLWYKGYNRGDE